MTNVENMHEMARVLRDGGFFDLANQYSNAAKLAEATERYTEIAGLAKEGYDIVIGDLRARVEELRNRIPAEYARGYGDGVRTGLKTSQGAAYRLGWNDAVNTVNPIVYDDEPPSAPSSEPSCGPQSPSSTAPLE